MNPLSTTNFDIIPLDTNVIRADQVSEKTKFPFFLDLGTNKILLVTAWIAEEVLGLLFSYNSKPNIDMLLENNVYLKANELWVLNNVVQSIEFPVGE